MFIINARGSYSGLSFLRDLYYFQPYHSLYGENSKDHVLRRRDVIFPVLFCKS